ncbi:hypothetical protein [Flagellimonas eckloniae]|uniref:Lipoprotein n=1 Tax=Flagellimonas eckloniae TaxID=346185 RepID=A0A0Q0XC20_9FLAO|nr:hypothetical protein [Allomuricauda eckloniae]KQC28632.1 hypothetical protein AAY42_00965 [Allomuricauda eckloniae]
MRNLTSVIGLVLLISFLFGCSSVKVTDSWRGIKTLNIKDKNILVVSKTEDRSVQIRFEKDMVQVLNENGYSSVESHIKFPFSDPTKKVEKDKIEEVIQNLRENDIDVVIVSHLLDSKEYTTTITTGDAFYRDPFPYRYHRYRSFYGYTGSYYTDYHTKEVEGITYILETLVYDLTNPTENQLISVITSKVDNPNSLGITSEDFSKSIVKNLTK